MKSHRFTSDILPPIQRAPNTKLRLYTQVYTLSFEYMSLLDSNSVYRVGKKNGEKFFLKIHRNYIRGGGIGDPEAVVSGQSDMAYETQVTEILTESLGMYC